MNKKTFSLSPSDFLRINSCTLCGCNKYQVLRIQKDISIYLESYPTYRLKVPDSFSKRKLVQCLQCSHVYWTQIPKLDSLPSFQSEILDYTFDESRALKEKAALLSYYLPSQGSLVDIGACRGELLKAVRSINRSASLTGVEPSFAATYDDESITIIQSLFDMETEIEASSVDIFSAVDVIEHLPDLSITFNAVSKFIRPGGYLFIESPDGSYPYNKLINYSSMNLFWIEHLSFLTRGSIDYVCKKFKFDVIFARNTSHFNSSRIRKYSSMAKYLVINKLIDRTKPLFVNSNDHLQLLLRKA